MPMRFTCPKCGNEQCQYSRLIEYEYIKTYFIYCGVCGHRWWVDKPLLEIDRELAYFLDFS